MSLLQGRNRPLLMSLQSLSVPSIFAIDFLKVVQINLNNSAARDEVESTMTLIEDRGYADRPADYEAFKKLARERWEEYRSKEDSWASRVSEEDFEILVGTGSMPWAEDVEVTCFVYWGTTRAQPVRYLEPSRRFQGLQTGRTSVL